MCEHGIMCEHTQRLLCKYVWVVHVDGILWYILRYSNKCCMVQNSWRYISLVYMSAELLFYKNGQSYMFTVETHVRLAQNNILFMHYGY